MPEPIIESTETDDLALLPEPAAETDEAKAKAREGYALRQAQKATEDLRKELEGYKRRDEEQRKAKLSEEQRIKEEVEALRAERESLRLDNLKRKIAGEYKLPDAFMARLVGSDEDSLRADAEELANYLPKQKVGGSTEPVRETVGSGGRIYTRAELKADPKLAASPEVLKAYSEGRVR